MIRWIFSLDPEEDEEDAADIAAEPDVSTPSAAEGEAHAAAAVAANSEQGAQSTTPDNDDEEQGCMYVVHENDARVAEEEDAPPPRVAPVGDARPSSRVLLLRTRAAGHARRWATSNSNPASRLSLHVRVISKV